MRPGPIAKRMEQKENAKARQAKRVRISRMSRHMVLVRQLDELARKLCMTRAGAFLVNGRSWYGPCRKCGEMKSLQWAHGYSRRFHSVRWDADNTFSLCAGCHYTFHHKPVEFRDWMLTQIGQEGLDRLALRLKTAKRPDLAALKVALELEWRQVEASDGPSS